MAGFKTHITVSTVIGVGYGVVANTVFDVHASTCILAGGLCSVSGMLPDVDSDTGVPFRESMAFAAAVIPMLMIERFQRLGMPIELMAIAGGAMYVAIRFGLAELLRHYTVHRGMWHSIPAMFIAGEVAFLVCSSGDLNLRCYKAGGVMLGFLTHLVLDEIWSVRMTYTGPRFKKSFGTALKFWSKSTWGNVSTYAKLILFGLLALNDPIWIEASPRGQELHRVASSILDRVVKTGAKVEAEAEGEIEHELPPDVRQTESAFLPHEPTGGWENTTYDDGRVY